MRKLFSVMLLAAIAFAFVSCSSKSSSDPLKIIDEISSNVSSSSDKWDEKEWNEATDKLESALSELPNPLEMQESIELQSALAIIRTNAGMHERKAARMLEVLEKYQEDDEDEEAIVGSYDMKGFVDKYPITMHLDINGTAVEGTYYYDRRGENAKLNLSGKLDGDDMDLNETDDKGIPTGHFLGEFDRSEFKGMFITNQGKRMPFVVSEKGAEMLELSVDEEDLTDAFESLADIGNDIDDEGDDFGDALDKEGDSSIDKFLNEYEKLIDDYVACFKKMKNDDPTAIANYAKIQVRYAKMVKQADRYKGEMSIKQAQRLNRITLKVTEAML